LVLVVHQVETAQHLHLFNRQTAAAWVVLVLVLVDLVGLVAVQAIRVHLLLELVFLAKGITAEVGRVRVLVLAVAVAAREAQGVISLAT